MYFTTGFDNELGNEVRKVVVKGRRVLDEEVIPYLVNDSLGRRFWFSPVSGEAVVIQVKVYNC
jgi:hypothetical protein